MQHPRENQLVIIFWMIEIMVFDANKIKNWEHKMGYEWVRDHVGEELQYVFSEILGPESICGCAYLEAQRCGSVVLNFFCMQDVECISQALNFLCCCQTICSATL